MINLTETELKELLERAAEAGSEKTIEKMTERLYQEVGKTVIKRMLQAFGGMIVATLFWAYHNGWFK